MFDKGPSSHCPVERCMDLIGSKWQLCIVWKLREKPYGFSDFLAEIPDISRKVLSQQLKALVEAGFVERVQTGRNATYSLSMYGKGFVASFGSVAVWAERNKDTVNKALRRKYPKSRKLVDV